MKVSKKANIVLFLVFIFIASIFLIPFVWMALSSLKPEADIMGHPERFFPRRITIENYRSLLVQIPFFKFLLNSVIFTGTVTVSSLLFDSLAGYAFAKLKFKGSNILFIIVLITMMIPFQITMIPIYLLLNEMKILNTYIGLILPRLTNAFGIYFMRQSFLSVPNELIDAGRIDGLSEEGIFFKVMLPVVASSLMSLGIFHFMYNWNDFLWPMLMTNTTSMQTLPVGLALFQGEHVSQHGPIFCGAVLSILPILIMYLFAQKSFIKGIALSGIKG